MMNNMNDFQIIDNLLAKIQEDKWINCVYADGSYYAKQYRQAILNRQAHIIILPRKNAKLGKDRKTVQLKEMSYWK